MVLKKGSTGPAVKVLQRALNERAAARGIVTRVAVDGRLGDSTWKFWKVIFTALGGWGFSGGVTRARRRYDIVVDPKVRTDRELARAAKWRAKRKVKKASKPKISRLGVSVTNKFGTLGSLIGTVGHYTAGPRDTSDAHAKSLWLQYHRQHAAQGWGGIGYHLGITTKGTIFLLRPVSLKGTHVAGANTGRIGVVVHGGPNQRMSAAQRASWKWLKDNAHTTAMPVSHRAPKKLSSLTIWGHNDLNATSCPGSYKSDYKE